MEDYQKRVISERSQLNNKIELLNTFINENAIFSTLPVEEQCDLMLQRHFMECYSAVLENRISRFNNG